MSKFGGQEINQVVRARKGQDIHIHIHLDGVSGDGRRHKTRDEVQLDWEGGERFTTDVLSGDYQKCPVCGGLMTIYEKFCFVHCVDCGWNEQYVDWGDCWEARKKYGEYLRDTEAILDEVRTRRSHTHDY